MNAPETISLQRAEPAALRSALNAAHMMATAGIMFVPVPVSSEEDAQALRARSLQHLQAMEAAAVALEKARA